MYASFTEVGASGLLIPDAPGCCDDCAHGRGRCGPDAPASSAALGALPGSSFSLGYQYGSPSYFGLDFGGLDFGGGFDFGGGSSFSLDQLPTSERKWYSPILDVVGDVGSDVLSGAVELLKRRFGEAVWDQMPQESKTAAVQRAISDFRGSAGSALMSPAVLIALGLLAVVLIAPTSRRRRR